MHKLIALYEKPADEAQFRNHLEMTHLPLVAKFPGLHCHEFARRPPSSIHQRCSIDAVRVGERPSAF